jgi:hypothetical protein
MPYSQPGIFNVLDSEYGMVPGSLGVPSENQTALQNAVNAAVAAGGGTILIPSEENGATTYNMQGPIYVGTATSPSPVSLIFAGTAQGTQSAPTMQVQTNAGGPYSGDLFYVDTTTTTDQDVGGITFQDLNIAYLEGASAPGAAIHVISGENVRLLRVILTNCPQGVWFEDTLQCSLLECTGNYTKDGNSGTMVTIGNDVMGVAGKEIYITGCKFASHTGGVGIEIQGAEHVRVSNTRIDTFYEGIKIVPGASMSGGHNTLRHSFEDVTVYAFTSDGNSGVAGAALTIQPQGPQNVSQIVFSHCLFEPDEMAEGSIGPGIYIDEGLYGGTIDNVRFVSCFSTRWSGPGIEITSGSNIEINGGFYSGNASGSNPSGGSGGVSITGAASGVRIIGASCVGSYPYIEVDKKETSPVQDIGIYIAGGGGNNIIVDHCDLRGNSQYAVSLSGAAVLTSEVFIRNCNMEGYTGNPIDFGADLSIIEATNCAGYNDQAAAITTTAPVSGATFSGTTYGYYGPVWFSATGGGLTVIEIDGHSTGLTSGSFTLGPRDTAKLTYTGVPTFVMIGQ